MVTGLLASSPKRMKLKGSCNRIVTVFAKHTADSDNGLTPNTSLRSLHSIVVAAAVDGKCMNLFRWPNPQVDKNVPPQQHPHGCSLVRTGRWVCVKGGEGHARSLPAESANKSLAFPAWLTRRGCVCFPDEMLLSATGRDKAETVVPQRLVTVTPTMYTRRQLEWKTAS